MASVVKDFLLERPTRLIEALPLASIAAIAGPRSLRRQRLNRRLVSAALAGLSEQELQLLLSTSGRRMARDVSFVAALGVAAVRASLATTRRTVVATATAYPLARAFLNELGLGSAELLASHVTSNAGVVSFTHHNVAYFKARSVLAAGIRPSAVHLYTDSATDLPLAQLCSRTSLVNPSRRSRAEFDRAGLAVEVLRW